MRLSRRAFGSLALAATVGLGGSLAALWGLEPSRSNAQGGTLTVYSGRSEPLIGPLLERFSSETGITVRARYGDSAELAAALLEEGANSPADVFFSQDAGALGAVAAHGMLSALPNETLARVDQRYSARDNSWVGVSGRARVIAYNTDQLTVADLPASIGELTDPKWRGKIGWAPTNASLQASITAMRLLEGEAAARQWLEGMKANEPKVYRNNTAVVQAVADGEIQVGLVNHYYLYNVMKERGPSIAVRNYHPTAGGAGAIVNVAGAGILASSKNQALGQRFIDYLLSNGAQQYFADETFEYPLVADVAPHPDLVPLGQINHPDLDLSNLADLDGTLRLMRETGVL